jgi:ankyrin repeat protein
MGLWQGRTALHHICAVDKPFVRARIISYLLQEDAHPAIPDAEGLTPLDMLLHGARRDYPAINVLLKRMREVGSPIILALYEEQVAYNFGP